MARWVQGVLRRSGEVQSLWRERSGRGLDDDFLIEAFSCQVWSFSVLPGRVQMAPEDLELRPWKSLEVRRSPELQNGGLRALEEA